MGWIPFEHGTCVFETSTKANRGTGHAFTIGDFMDATPVWVFFPTCDKSLQGGLVVASFDAVGGGIDCFRSVASDFPRTFLFEATRPVSVDPVVPVPT